MWEARRGEHSGWVSLRRGRVEGVGPTVLVKSYKKYNLGGGSLPKLFQLFQVRLKSSLETQLLSDLLSLPCLPCAILLMSSSAGQVA